MCAFRYYTNARLWNSQHSSWYSEIHGGFQAREFPAQQKLLVSKAHILKDNMVMQSRVVWVILLLTLQHWPCRMQHFSTCAWQHSTKGSSSLAPCTRDPAFVSWGYTYWKEVSTAFKRHQNSDCHKEAMEAIVSLPQQAQDVGELLHVSRSHYEEKATNRRMFLKVVWCIKFLANQNLSLRGVGAHFDSNLMQLLQMECHDFPEL